MIGDVSFPGPQYSRGQRASGRSELLLV